MDSRKQKIIFLVPIGNVQGYLFVFKINIGRILKMRNVAVLIMPYRIINKFDSWGRRYQKVNSTTKIKFLNITEYKYNWDNRELDKDDEVGFVEGVPHLTTSANIPGARLEDNITGPAIVDV